MEEFKMKKFSLFFYFLSLWNISLSTNLFNKIDYAAFYTKDGKNYVEVGAKDNKNIDLNISKYILEFDDEIFEIPLYDEKNKEMYSVKTNEFLAFETKNKILTGDCSGFFYDNKNDIDYFFKGGFYSNTFIGKIVVTKNNTKQQKYVTLEFDGTFVLRGTNSGVDKDYKNNFFKLNKTFGTRYTMKKYIYGIRDNELKDFFYEKQTLGSSIFSLKDNLQDQINKCLKF